MNNGQMMNQMGGGGGGSAEDPNMGMNNDSYAQLGLNVDPGLDWRDMRYRQKVNLCYFIHRKLSETLDSGTNRRAIETSWTGKCRKFGPARSKVG